MWGRSLLSVLDNYIPTAAALGGSVCFLSQEKKTLLVVS